jgi:ribulose 1,5-bisphosphate synthetase/thiazole synthase
VLLSSYTTIQEHFPWALYLEGYNKMTIPEEVDIIICGGGSSGCVPAGRLANLDHNLSVLLIEAGENNLNNPW